MHLRLERLLRRRDARKVVAVPEVVELAAMRVHRRRAHPRAVGDGHFVRDVEIRRAQRVVDRLRVAVRADEWFERVVGTTNPEELTLEF